MSTTLRDFIANREGEIRDQLKALKGELKELQVAKAALDGQEVASPVSQSSGPTIKDMARAVLTADIAKNGMTSAGILGGIKEEFGREIDRTSLSPQLSRLKDSGELVLVGDNWFTAAAHAAWVKSMGSIFSDDDEEKETVYEVDDDDL